MGCDYYCVQVPQNWSSDKPDEEMYKEVYISFPVDGELGCLCTFPINYIEDPSNVPVKLLAMLGAAVVLARHKDISSDKTHWLPNCLPRWIIEGINQKVVER